MANVNTVTRETIFVDSSWSTNVQWHSLKNLVPNNKQMKIIKQPKYLIHTINLSKAVAV